MSGQTRQTDPGTVLRFVVPKIPKQFLIYHRTLPIYTPPYHAAYLTAKLRCTPLLMPDFCPFLAPIKNLIQTKILAEDVIKEIFELHQEMEIIDERSYKNEESEENNEDGRQIIFQGEESSDQDVESIENIFQNELSNDENVESIENIFQDEEKLLNIMETIQEESEPDCETETIDMEDQIEEEKYLLHDFENTLKEPEYVEEDNFLIENDILDSESLKGSSIDEFQCEEKYELRRIVQLRDIGIQVPEETKTIICEADYSRNVNFDNNLETCKAQKLVKQSPKKNVTPYPLLSSKSKKSTLQEGRKVRQPFKLH